ncbi:proline dehydrogenase family protein [Cohnella rhizosphaerae]|uniref:proline dehydrogenase n=1 Tax=Cohnella rhizosphaerae TaxID=1457232 RepID=A0A9X4KPC9_9BACL|nr:proline dehydrogenase family protein [Cohnella rhizosphaerae]MDG0808292.1 proline dehydrogenase family protein [Cohnella rhizosphaerae]
MNIGSTLYRKAMTAVAANRAVKRLTLRYGRKLARRFVASDHLQGALREVAALNRQGISATMDALGEGIGSLEEARAYRDEYLKLLDAIADSGVRANVSLKPTQMGLALDAEACIAHIREIAVRARQYGNFVRIDMEDSPYTQATIDMTVRLHRAGLTNVGTVLQAYLKRTVGDARDLIEAGVPLRLVKGAYREPAAIAFERKADVLASFRSIVKLHLDRGAYTAIASHDDAIVGWTKQYARQNGIAKDRFEFQMLYGLRMSEQARLAKEGYRVRCYVPYGTMWYPYYTRRLAEKPGNLWLVAKHLLR